MTIVVYRMHGKWEIQEVELLDPALRLGLHMIVHSNSRLPGFRLLVREKAMYSAGYRWYEWEYDDHRKRVFYRLVSDALSHVDLLKELEALIIVAGY
ncbi:hypothetical protein [Pseudomonas phage vB_PaeP_PS28]|nr:hypothetical protein [Pseudomonas phage vB_PaeP_PS28]